MTIGKIGFTGQIQSTIAKIEVNSKQESNEAVPILKNKSKMSGSKYDKNEIEKILKLSPEDIGQTEFSDLYIKSPTTIELSVKLKDACNSTVVVHKSVEEGGANFVSRIIEKVVETKKGNILNTKLSWLTKDFSDVSKVLEHLLQIS